MKSFLTAFIAIELVVLCTTLVNAAPTQLEAIQPIEPAVLCADAQECKQLFNWTAIAR